MSWFSWRHWVVLLHCIFLEIQTTSSKEICPLLCPPGYQTPYSCTKLDNPTCVECPDGWHKSVDDFTSNVAAYCVENKRCDLPKYLVTTNRINGSVCDCLAGFYPDPYDYLHHSCKRCSCCDDSDSEVEQACQGNPEIGANCRSGTRYVNCAKPTSTTSTNQITSQATTQNSSTDVVTNKISTILDVQPTTHSATSKAAMKHNSQPTAHPAPNVGSGNYNNLVTISVVLLLGVGIIVIISVSYVTVLLKRRKHWDRHLQQYSVTVMDPEGGQHNVVYELPIELRSQFDSYCQKDTREKFMVQMEDMTELQAPSLDARMDQQEIKEELEGEPSDSSDRLDYRGPEMSVMFRSRTHSGSLEDLTSFPHPTSRNDMSHSQTSGEEEPCTSRRRNRAATLPVAGTCNPFNWRGRRRIPKSGIKGITRAVFADHSTWDPTVGFLSCEEEKKLECYYYGLANIKYETYEGEDLFLIALPTEVLWQISRRLDIPHDHDYRDLASSFIDDKVFIDHLQVEYFRKFGSPTLQLLKHLMGIHPPIEIDTLRQTLCDMGRRDCADLLSPYIESVTACLDGSQSSSKTEINNSEESFQESLTDSDSCCHLITGDGGTATDP